MHCGAFLLNACAVPGVLSQNFVHKSKIVCPFIPRTFLSLMCRFVGGIRSEVEKLEKTLLLFSENLDEWLAVQRSWMYLESIFGAPDIQRQLPGPAKAFQVIDKEFRSIMRSVKQKPLALAVWFLPAFPCMQMLLHASNHSCGKLPLYSIIFSQSQVYPTSA